MQISTLQRWLSFPVSPAEITIPGSQCPLVDPFTNQAQAAEAVLELTAWQSLFSSAFFVSAGIAFLVVAFAYHTRIVGNPFLRRWLQSLVIAFVASTVVVGAMLIVVQVPTFGCVGGETVARIPPVWVVSRSFFAGVHGTILFFFLSALLGQLLGRALRLPGWYDNQRVPLPHLIQRR